MNVHGSWGQPTGSKSTGLLVVCPSKGALLVSECHRLGNSGLLHGRGYREAPGPKKG